MIAVVLGIATALIYGFADFFGAIASRRLRPILVTGLAGWVGLFGLLALTGIGLLHANYSSASVVAGLVGGLFSAFGLACLYQALAIGPISIVSPFAAVVGAILPVAVGAVALGEHFGWLAWLAIALVLISIVLVAYQPQGGSSTRPSLRAMLFAAGAGLGIGAVLIALHWAPHSDGVAAATLMRATNATILGAVVVILLASKRSSLAELAQIGGRTWVAIAATGVLDATANVFFVAASGFGSLTVVSVLTSLYPLGTIVLARFVLKEKLAFNQAVGVALALAASVLLALQ